MADGPPNSLVTLLVAVAIPQLCRRLAVVNASFAALTALRASPSAAEGGLSSPRQTRVSLLCCPRGNVRGLSRLGAHRPRPGHGDPNTYLHRYW